jgi:hypothetical protein
VVLVHQGAQFVQTPPFYGPAGLLGDAPDLVKPGLVLVWAFSQARRTSSTTSRVELGMPVSPMTRVKGRWTQKISNFWPRT